MQSDGAELVEALHAAFPDIVSTGDQLEKNMQEMTVLSAAVMKIGVQKSPEGKLYYVTVHPWLL